MTSKLGTGAPPGPPSPPDRCDCGAVSLWRNPAPDASAFDPLTRITHTRRTCLPAPCGGLTGDDAAAVPVAGSASFGEALADLDRAVTCLAVEVPEAVARDVRRIFNECRARVESLHRDEVERRVNIINTLLHEKAKAIEDRDEARAERDRLAAALRALLWCHDSDNWRDAEAPWTAARAALPGHADDAATSGDHPNSSNEEG